MSKETEKIGFCKFVDSSFIDPRTKKWKRRYFFHLVSADVVESSLPFNPGEMLKFTIQDQKVVIERVDWKGRGDQK